MLRQRFIDIALLLLVLGVAAAVTAPMLPAAFDGSAESWGGAYYSTAARNLLRYGPGDVRFAMVVQVGPIVETPLAYANHPPLVVWLVSAVFAVFGEGEIQARVIPWLLSVVAAGGMFGLLRRVGASGAWAAAGALVAVGTPMWARYATMVDPQGSGPLAAMVLLALVATAPPRWYRSLALVAVAVPGLLFDWPVTGAVLLVAVWLLRERSGRVDGVLLLLTAATVLLGLGIWTANLDDVATLVANPLDTARSRAALGAVLAHDDGSLLTRGDVWRSIFTHHRSMIFLPLTAGGAAAGLGLMVSITRGHTPPRAALLLVPGLVGLSHVVVFSQGAAVHRFWQFYLGPGAALTLTAGLAFALPSRARPLAGKLLLVGALALCLRSGSLAQAWADTDTRGDLRRVGTILRQHTRVGDILASGAPRSVAIDWYADRDVRWGERVAGDRRWTGLIGPPEGPMADAATVRWGGPTQLPGDWALWLPK
jgi:hypothetical protein